MTLQERPKMRPSSGGRLGCGGRLNIFMRKRLRLCRTRCGGRLNIFTTLRGSGFVANRQEVPANDEKPFCLYSCETEIPFKVEEQRIWLPSVICHRWNKHVLAFVL
jgi:hypothetical protein